MKILLCYITGLDLRRVNRETTPFLSESFEECPWAPMTNLPSNELLPTIVTGVYPEKHGVYGVKLKARYGTPRPQKWTERLPDFVTTSAQCLTHFLTKNCDLPAIPPRRRREFAITRTKYIRRKKPFKILASIGGMPSLLGVVGKEKSRYLFSNATNPTRKLLPRVGSGHYELEFLELYSLDRFQQWNLPRPDKIRKYYARIDRFLQLLHEKCRSAGVTLVILSDHGHEAVRGWIDVKGQVAQLGIPEDEYSYFLELYVVRFWFQTDRAREKITEFLQNLDHTRFFPYQEMSQHHLVFADSSYGEVFAMADPGYIFFPHDFHQPLANLALGLTDSKQIPRIFDPRQRSNHGYLQPHECEKGFMLVLDKELSAAAGEMELTDVAPSTLVLLGRERPPSMEGKVVFT